MDLNKIPLLSVLKGRMSYVSQRQKLISENVANSNTPDFAPSDLKAFTFDAALRSQGVLPQAGQPIGAARTQSSHLTGNQKVSGPWKPEESPDSEARLDGNQVVLEDEMLKMTTAKLDYDAAISFYQQSMGMLKMAIRKPGG
jgi:flagellar basal-body rod protein FlgB